MSSDTPLCRTMFAAEGFSISIIRGDAARGFEDFTFPIFREKLFLNEKDPRFVGLGLKFGDAPCGLALAEYTAPLGWRLVSLFVEEPFRNEGLGGALVDATESEVRERGGSRLGTVYRTTIPEREAFERVLARQGWSPPSLRMMVLEAEFNRISQSPFLTESPVLDPGFELVPWHEVPREEIEHLGKRGFSVRIWPLNYSDDYHRPTSFGLRWRGELCGWLVNHLHSPGFLRFTSSYLVDELQGKGQFAAVMAESVRRMPAAGMHRGIWTVPMEFRRMIAFSKRRLAPYCESVTQTYGSFKKLN